MYLEDDYDDDDDCEMRMMMMMMMFVMVVVTVDHDDDDLLIMVVIPKCTLFTDNFISQQTIMVLTQPAPRGRLRKWRDKIGHPLNTSG